MPHQDALAALDKALAGWKQFNGDQPSRDELVNAIDELIEARNLAMYTANPPFICADTLTDADYEALLKPGKPYEFTKVDVETLHLNVQPMRYISEKNPVVQPIQYIGEKRPTCATCGALMVDGLCSADGAHYQ